MVGNSLVVIDCCWLAINGYDMNGKIGEKAAMK
jgi:hypothetical protein